MSNSYSLLLDTAALLKVDTKQVKEDEKRDCSAILTIEDVKVTVSRDKKSPILSRAKFSYIGSNVFSIKSEPFLSDYAEKLARMIKSVVYKKMYSAPWVAAAVKERLAKKVKKCKVRLENDHVAILTLWPTKESKKAKKLQLSIVELGGNDIGSYFYRVNFLDGITIGSVTDVADLDTAINDIVNIAAGAYDRWVKDGDADAEPKSGYERDMADLYQFLKSRYKNMKDSSLTFTRTSGKSLSISNIRNGDNYYITCDSNTADIRVCTNRRYSCRDKCFKRDDPKLFEKVASIVFGFESEE